MVNTVSSPQKVSISPGFHLQLDVSKNRGTPKWMVYNWKTLLKWMIWGYHYFWKHPICLFPPQNIGAPFLDVGAFVVVF